MIFLRCLTSKIPTYDSRGFVYKYVYARVYYMSRIYQGVLLIVFEDNSKKWHRISRRKFESLVTYVRGLNNFRYAKLYDIPNYRPTKSAPIGYTHKIGQKIGYITKNGSDYSENGLFDKPRPKYYK